MRVNIAPKTVLGKWSVGLNILFLIVIITSIILVKIFGVLSFDDHWWDVTVPIALLANIIAFSTGIISAKNKDSSILVFFSIFTGICVILFILFHGLFIND